MPNFKEIRTIDPKIIFKSGTILIKPFYLNYSFIVNFVGIGILIYVLTLEDDYWISLGSYVLIGVASITMLGQLRHFNTTHVDIKERVIKIFPNLFFWFFVKSKAIEFKGIKKIIVISNFKTSGYWIMNRRYYITVILKTGEEIKLISSNKESTAKEISETITAAL